jgi:hypothetical protein
MKKPFAQDSMKKWGINKSTHPVRNRIGARSVVMLGLLQTYMSAIPAFNPIHSTPHLGEFTGAVGIVRRVVARRQVNRYIAKSAQIVNGVCQPTSLFSCQEAAAIINAVL